MTGEAVPSASVSSIRKLSSDAGALMRRYHAVGCAVIVIWKDDDGEANIFSMGYAVDGKVTPKDMQDALCAAIVDNATSAYDDEEAPEAPPAA